MAKNKQHKHQNALVLFAILLILSAVALIINTKNNVDQYSIEEETILLEE